MKLFSFDWFKSEKDKEMEALRMEEQKMKNEILKKDLEMWNDVPVKLEEKPQRVVKSVKLTNSVLTVVLNDGDIISKTNATKQDFENVRNAANEEMVLSFVLDQNVVKEKQKIEQEIKKVEDILKGIELLKNTEDFVVENNSVKMRDNSGNLIDRTLPQLLVEKFTTVLDKPEEFQALKKFWLKCCLNPNAQSAEDLYGFLANHHFKIDRHGNFYAYRRVVSKNTQNKELVEFVSNTYTKVKAVWKKKPSSFYVFGNNSSNFSIKQASNDAKDWETPLIGNLEQLYLDLPNMQEKSYTSAHTGMEDYRVGEVHWMPRDDGDDNNRVSCSKGFHAASKAYDYSGFGDTPILVIINPMDVLAVPHREVGKLRTNRWFFATTLDENEEHILDNEDYDVTDLGDVFEEKCLNGMKDYVKTSFAEEIKRHTFQLPTLTATDVTNIVTSLEQMKETLSKRVSTI